jgi:hypothetical protein
MKSRFELWDQHDAIFDSLLPGLSSSMNALSEMKRAWAEEPRRSRVLDRIKTIIAVSDNDTYLQLFPQKCLAQAYYLLHDYNESLAIINIIKEQNIHNEIPEDIMNAINTLYRIIMRIIAL